MPLIISFGLFVCNNRIGFVIEVLKCNVLLISIKEYKALSKIILIGILYNAISNIIQQI
jgi:hypothetical protein